MHDAWFFIGVFVFIFLIWIATGGPTHPISFTGPTLAQPDVLGGGTYLSLPRANFGYGKASNVVLPGSTGSGSSLYGSQGSTGTAAPTETTYPSGVPGVTFSAPSPYRNVVSFSGYVANASSSDPKQEYVQIYVAQNSSTAIDISGWALRSAATDKVEVVPKGTTVPTSGVVNATEDIILSPGDSAYLISGESPVGASFRTNKCIGYFGSFQTFTPSLPLNCPAPSNELSSYYGTPYIHDTSCIDYVNSLSRCQTAVIPSSKNLTLTCEDFVDSHLNYNGCLANHRSESDFNGTTWYIYLGRRPLSQLKYTATYTEKQDAGPLWRAKYDVVQLLDDRGRTVASFNY